MNRENSAKALQELSPKEFLANRRKFFSEGIERRNSLLQEYPHLAGLEISKGLQKKEYNAWQTISNFKDAETELQDIEDKLEAMG
ncbi:hypothetical protein KKG65_00225 [Patescibacteria group bacterium]|nr:hypothetical protein [Patescibacteria group bacterium]